MSKVNLVHIFFLIALSVQATEDSPQFVVFEGRAYDSSDLPLTSTSVEFNFKIYNPAKSCILYEETQSAIDLNASSGFFALSVGSKISGGGKRSGNDPGLTMANVFQNLNAIVGKDSGGGACNYAPTAGHQRVLVVTMSPSGRTSESFPDVSINSVPQALVAETLQGILPTGFIQVAGNVTQANMTTLTGAGDASALHHHDSRYLASGSSVALSANSYVDGNFGIGTSSPSSNLGFGGNTDRTLGVNRTTGTDGADLTVSAGGAVSAGTNRAGGDLIMSSGTSTGSGDSKIEFKTATAAGGSGSADNAPSTKMTILGNGNVGIGTTTPSSLLNLYSSSPKLTLESTSSGSPDVTFRNSAGALSLNMNSSRDLQVIDLTAGPSRLVLQGSNGNLGIGDYYGPSNYPQGKLAVSGSLAVGYATGTAFTAPTNGAAISGNVGIGTTAPKDKLEVVGGMRVGQAPASPTTVNGNHNSSVTTITVASTTGYPASGTLFINGEAMTYTGITATTFTGVTRGSLGTVAKAIGDGEAADILSASFTASATNPRFLVKADEGAYAQTNSSSTNSVDSVLTLFHNTSGTPAAGIGPALLFSGTRRSPAEVWPGAGIAGIMQDVDDNEETEALAFFTSSNGNSVNFNAQGGDSGEKMRIAGNGNVGIGSTSPTAKLEVVGGTVTTSTPALSVTQTWNNGATGFTAVKVNVTDTASLGSYLLDLQVGGTSKFWVRQDGVTETGYLSATNWMKTNQVYFNHNFTTVLQSDAADVLAQRRSTNPQTFRLYNTYTSTTNYELGKFEWSANTLNIGTEKGSGGGTARNLSFQTDGTTRMTVDTTGNVGVGTASPSYGLQLATGKELFVGGPDNKIYLGDVNNWLRRYSSDGATEINAPFSSAGIRLLIDSTSALSISSARNVGVGTTSPASRMHVNGAGAGGGLCVTSDDACGAVPTGGQISAETTLNTGADYAEYFLSEELLNSGQIVGINPITKLARGYRSGDLLLGVVSTRPGVIGNSRLQKERSVLVALVGQVPYNRSEVRIDGNLVLTRDGNQIGFLLASGDLYLNVGSKDYDRKIANLETENAVKTAKLQRLREAEEKKSMEILSLKSDNQNLKIYLCGKDPSAPFCR